MKLFEHPKTERTLDPLPDLPPSVEVPDDISGLGPPTTLKPTAGGIRWMRWLAAIVVLGAVGVLAAALLSSSDPDPVAVDYLATYGTDNPAFVQEGAVAGTVEIVGTVDYMATYGTDNPVFVGEAQYMELFGTDNPVFVPETLYMELYGTDNPVFVLGTASAETVDTGQYMELYGTDNPVFVTPEATWAVPAEGPGSNSLTP